MLAAGCLDDDTFQANASDPILMAPPATPKYGYDGQGMVASTGTLTMDVDDNSNTGSVDVELNVPSGPYRGTYTIHWTDFHNQPNQTWQDGGIACDLAEHGATGHGNKMEPRMDLHCAGWGTATAARDGQPVTDPMTGSTSFNAHFMVSKQAMLHDGKVTKADGVTPFDPLTPGDGHVVDGRNEGHFALWGQGAYKDGIAQAPLPAETSTVADTATSATYAREYPVAITAPGARLTVEAAAGIGIGQLTVTLRDPEGIAVSQETLLPTMAVSLQATAPLTPGEYVVEVTGAGAQLPYTLDITVTPPEPFLLHAVFQAVELAE
jgi:hypothetical protein